MTRAFTRIAFSADVKQAQREYGTRDWCAMLENGSPANDVITTPVAEFIKARSSFFLATCNTDGWPHVQYRGGPVGLLKVLTPTLIAFGDFNGNKQLITVGNILSNPHVHLLLIDGIERRRLKIWGIATVHSPRCSHVAQAVRYPDYPDQIARLIAIDVKAWDWNCASHLTNMGTRRLPEPWELAPFGT